MNTLANTVQLIISIKVRLSEVVHAISHDTDKEKNEEFSNYEHD